MMWWSGKGDGVGCMGIMVKEELCEVLEIRRVSERVMAVVLVIEEEVLRLICWKTRQSGRKTVFL